MRAQFFAQTFYSESDLDLYIYPDFFLEVMTWLVSQGYVFEPTPAQPTQWQDTVEWGLSRSGTFENQDHVSEYVDRSIQAVLTLVKSSQLICGFSEQRIQCILAAGAPMQTILSYHSTCVLNVISYENAYCLYPRGTLLENRTLICGTRLLAHRPEALQKYQNRGYELVTPDQRADKDYASIHKLHRSFPEVARYVGDPLCWTIPLDTTDLNNLPGIQVPRCMDIMLRHDPVCTVTWNLKIDRKSESSVYLQKRTRILPILHLRYIALYGSYYLAKGFGGFLFSQRDSQRAGLQPGEVWVPTCIDDKLIEWCLEHYPKLWAVHHISGPQS